MHTAGWARGGAEVRPLVMSNPPSSGNAAGSFAEYLRVVAPHLREELVAESSRARLGTLASHLPVCSKAVLEFRLGESPQVDLSLCLPRDRVPIASPLLVDPRWRRLRAIGDEWMSEKSFIHRAVRQLWVEFDGEIASAEPPSPMIFLTTDRSAGTRDHLEEMARTLLRRPAAKPLTATFRRLQQLTPSSAWFKHLGRMERAERDPLRLVLAHFPGGEAVGFLEAFGWRDEGGRLGQALRELAGLVDYFALSVDVFDGIGPRVCLECFMDSSAASPARWTRLFSYLSARRLCAPEKSRALLAWPGVNRKPAEGGYWPQSLELGDALMGANGLSVFFRTMSHVKLSFEPGKTCEAKAYVGFEHVWLNPERLEGAGRKS